MGRNTATTIGCQNFVKVEIKFLFFKCKDTIKNDDCIYCFYSLHTHATKMEKKVTFWCALIIPFLMVIISLPSETVAQCPIANSNCTTTCGKGCVSTSTTIVASSTNNTYVTYTFNLANSTCNITEFEIPFPPCASITYTSRCVQQLVYIVAGNCDAIFDGRTDIWYVQTNATSDPLCENSVTFGFNTTVGFDVGPFMFRSIPTVSCTQGCSAIQATTCIPPPPEIPRQCSTNGCFANTTITPFIFSQQRIGYTFGIQAQTRNSTVFCPIDSVLMGIPSCAQITSTFCVASMTKQQRNNTGICLPSDVDMLIANNYTNYQDLSIMEPWLIKLNSGCKTFMLNFNKNMIYNIGHMALNNYTSTNCSMCNQTTVAVICNDTFYDTTTTAMMTTATTGTTGTTGTSGTTGTTGICIQHRPQIIIVRIAQTSMFSSIPSFVPQSLDITAGDSIIFQNDDYSAAFHAVNSVDDILYQSGPLPPGTQSPNVFTPFFPINTREFYRFYLNDMREQIEFLLFVNPEIICDGAISSTNPSPCIGFGPTTYDIVLGINGFSPSFLQITEYDYIDFINRDNIAHNISLVNGTYSTGKLLRGQTSSTYSDFGFIGNKTFVSDFPKRFLTVEYIPLECTCFPYTPITHLVTIFGGEFAPINMNVTKGDKVLFRYDGPPVPSDGSLLRISLSLDNSTYQNYSVDLAPGESSHFITNSGDYAFIGCCLVFTDITDVKKFSLRIIDAPDCADSTNIVSGSTTAGSVPTGSGSTASTAASSSTAALSTTASGGGGGGSATTGISPATAGSGGSGSGSGSGSGGGLTTVNMYVGSDCNNNEVDDLMDITLQISQDVNGNDIPDECENESYIYSLYFFMTVLVAMSLTLFVYIYQRVFHTIPVVEYCTDSSRSHSD